MYDNLAKLQPVILAGGNSSRMGYNKIFAKFGDSTLIETIYTLLQFTFVLPPIIVTSDKRLFQSFTPLKDAIILEDEYPGRYTLGAVLTALHYTEADNIFVIGCDMPFISLEVIERMAANQGEAEAVVPMKDGDDICMHAIYSRKLIPIIEKKVAAGEKLLHSFYREVPLLHLPIQDTEEETQIFIDVNTPDDLRFAQEIYEKHSS